MHEFLRRIVDNYHVPMFCALNDAVPGFAEMDFVDAFASVPMVNVSIVNEFIRLIYSVNWTNHSLFRDSYAGGERTGIL